MGAELGSEEKRLAGAHRQGGVDEAAGEKRAVEAGVVSRAAPAGAAGARTGAKEAVR